MSQDTVEVEHDGISYRWRLIHDGEEYASGSAESLELAVQAAKRHTYGEEPEIVIL